MRATPVRRMFGLQKQRRNATSSGARFIAGHLTVFAKLSHHAVRLESRIFSFRCFRVLRNLPPPVFPFAMPPSRHLSYDVRFLSFANNHHHSIRDVFGDVRVVRKISANEMEERTTWAKSSMRNNHGVWKKYFLTWVFLCICEKFKDKRLYRIYVKDISNFCLYLGSEHFNTILPSISLVF